MSHLALTSPAQHGDIKTCHTAECYYQQYCDLLGSYIGNDPLVPELQLSGLLRRKVGDAVAPQRICSCYLCHMVGLLELHKHEIRLDSVQS